MAGPDAAKVVSPGVSGDACERPGDPLPGRRVLIAEDDPYITLALEEALVEHGVIVAGAARTIGDALRYAREASVDIALLDVNLGQERIDVVAEALARRGLPFIFTSGCGRAGLPEAFADRPIVEKPFFMEEIFATLRRELESAGNA